MDVDSCEGVSTKFLDFRFERYTLRVVVSFSLPGGLALFNLEERS